MRISPLAFALLVTLPASARAQLRVHEVGRGAKVLILLHGWGAAGDDLVPLARMLAAQLPLRVLVPEAPMARKRGGRAWFDPYAGPKTGAQVQAARRQLLEVIQRATKAGARPEHIFVGGFSQGAIMSMDLAVHGAGLGGVVMLSGTELPMWKRYDKLKGTPVLMVHGRQDPVLSFAAAERLKTRLLSAGAKVTWLPFQGGHTVPKVGTDAMISFLRAKLLSAPPSR